MEQMYDIFEFTYINEGGSLEQVVWARNEETAQKIIDLENQCTSFHWIPKKKKFMVATQTNRPPYELEQEQLEIAKLKLERRQAKYAKKKGN
ncbi:MAG: hypothetical protein J6J11_07370 [Treponema sp.]|nr:hypothetical protein [Treponema sp.]